MIFQLKRSITYRNTAEAKVFYGNGTDHPQNTPIDLGFEPKIIIMRWCFNDWISNYEMRVWVSPELENTFRFYVHAAGNDNARITTQSEPPSDFIINGTIFTYTSYTSPRYMNFIAIG